MQTHALKPLALAVAAMLAAASTAHAADVTVTPPSGGGFVVQTPSAQALFSIDANGQLTIANLDSAPAQATPLCYADTSGAVGKCTGGGVVERTGLAYYEKLVSRADDRLYEAKREGRNRICG